MAVSEDGEPDNLPQEMIDDHAGVSLTRNPAQTGATRRQVLHDQERRLLDQGSHVFGWVRDTTAGTFWSRLNGVDFMNSSCSSPRSQCCACSLPDHRFGREWR
jgi:hypothetical protein